MGIHVYDISEIPLESWPWYESGEIDILRDYFAWIAVSHDISIGEEE